MTTTPPPQRPEGELIDAARRRISPRMSARKAAALAGISEGRWRHIVSGYQSQGGVYLEVKGPHDTVARMARAVGVTPEQLRDAGRGDAADTYEKLFSEAEVEPTAPAAEIVDVTELLDDPDWEALVLAVKGAPQEQQAAMLRMALTTVKALEQEIAARTGGNTEAPSESGR